MIHWYPFIALLVVSLACAYLRTRLVAWTITGFAAVIGIGLLAGSHWLAIAITALVFAVIVLPLNIPEFRRRRITAARALSRV